MRCWLGFESGLWQSRPEATALLTRLCAQSGLSSMISRVNTDKPPLPPLCSSCEGGWRLVLSSGLSLGLQAKQFSLWFIRSENYVSHICQVLYSVEWFSFWKLLVSPCSNAGALLQWPSGSWSPPWLHVLPLWLLRLARQQLSEES